MELLGVMVLGINTSKKLFLRFMFPEKGKVTIDGKLVSSLSLGLG